jgi:Domain of unknown function (DUF4157)/DNase/tRNase domain of colicin-like bacteriocin
MRDRIARHQREPASAEHERVDEAPALRPRRGAPMSAISVLNLQRSCGNQAVQQMIQRTRETTRAADGRLPAGLAGAVESLAGVGMDDVRVHFDSAKPSEVGALAYAQGAEIHLGPGQEQQLPHEAWHVAQQKQGRARADAQVDGRPVASDLSLEREADAMGEAVMRVAADPEAPLAAPAEPAHRPAGRGVLQAKWQEAGKLDQWELTRQDLEGALLDLAKKVNSDLLPQYVGISEFLANSTLREQLRQYLKQTLQDQAEHPTRELLEQAIILVSSAGRASGQSVVTGDDEENDHPEEDATQPEDELITDPSHVNTNELQNAPQVLEIIFRNVAIARGWAANDVTPAAFVEWKSAGVVTRNGFDEIIKRNRPDGTQQPMQMKRTKNTPSGPSSYTSSNFGNFTNVVYTTDGKANIDFKFTTSHGVWSNPVMPGTVVKLQTGATRPGYGILNNGYETKLFKAGRNRHNMIANRLRPDLVAAATASYTWHHRSKEYEMELVDYMTHRKHGHNGGYLFWQDGQ